ncbi:triphosphoribosyl-dephospho-CoA synthase CitG [Mesorhizobium sp. SARCC-RB16n]|uniref:triphosphoribosyl-dephospho-CoA synthase CitG n=1 Tax=Mesorhizobium sp. SARCC-RB16n TaxID=2116687 RepID=UPI001FF052A3|nr:triphosphoribosyl-dephospho-CoA synthase CitG [Mesorhizobium sp. SARCC-RB16n]
MNMIYGQPYSSPSRASQDKAQQTIGAAAIADYVNRALLTEVMLTPKPGLVDTRNCGAHYDMDINTFLASARAIAPWWPRFLEMGHESAGIAACLSLPLVRPIGLQCEQAMLQATHGINTHKGAIFSFGLLCFAAGRLLTNGFDLTRESMCAEVGGICAGLVDRELRGTPEARTAGERAFLRFGFPGARGEAASGFATVRTAALPVYDGLRFDGVSEEMALLQALLHLLAVNDDTNLVSRGGLAGLGYVRTYATKLLQAGGALAPDGAAKMAAFDDALISRHLSPGGTADLLGLTWFIAQFPAVNEDARI